MFLLILIAVVTWIVQFFLPWWSMPLVSFILAAFMARSAGHAFVGGFIGCGLTWVLMAIFTSISRGSLMTQKIAELFSLPSTWILYLVAFLIAGIAGGLAALTGFYLQSLRRNPKQQIS